MKQPKFSTFHTCLIHQKVLYKKYEFVFIYSNYICLRICRMIFFFFGPSGRVKNPEFLTEVSSAISKEDKLVVVIC